MGMHGLDLSTSVQNQYAATSEGRMASLKAQLEQARERIAELEGRDALKTQFLANISHDLRTPLTAVITHAEILRDGILGQLTDRQIESVGGIINGGRQLLQQVGEILTYARGAANQLTLTPSTFYLGDVVSQLNALNESLASKKGVGLVTEVPLELELGLVTADREKVAHIVGNLLGNAIDFTPRGGRVWVHASASRDPTAPSASWRSVIRVSASLRSITNSCSANSRKSTPVHRASIMAQDSGSR